MLYDLSFSCPSGECPKDYKYGDMVTHLSKDCQNICFSCPYNCNTKGKREDLESHIQFCDQAQMAIALEISKQEELSKGSTARPSISIK